MMTQPNYDRIFHHEMANVAYFLLSVNDMILVEDYSFADFGTSTSVID